MHTVHRQVTKHRLGLCHGYSLWVADGVNHIDFLDAGTTMNSECYIATFKTLKQQFKKVQKQEKNILPQNNNARPHTL